MPSPFSQEWKACTPKMQTCSSWKGHWGTLWSPRATEQENAQRGKNPLNFLPIMWTFKGAGVNLGWRGWPSHGEEVPVSVSCRKCYRLGGLRNSWSSLEWFLNEKLGKSHVRRLGLHVRRWRQRSLPTSTGSIPVLLICLWGRMGLHWI